MNALEPRWGGSYEQMLGYASELKQYLPRRPQLAIHVEKPFADRGDRLIADDRYTNETIDVLEAAVAIGSDEDALYDAADAAINSTEAKPDPLKGAAYLLQESRFREVNAWADRNIARALVQMEPEWSLRYSLRAISLDPDNAWAHGLAGAGYSNIRSFPEAEQQYLISMEDPGQRHGSLQEVAQMWFFGDRLDRGRMAKAKPYIDQLLREYPEDGRGWILDLQRRMVTGEPFGVDTIKATLKKIDRSDDWQEERAEWLEGVVRQMQSPPQKTRH